MLGYATVGVNLRGTGCSGGAWRLLRDAAVARRLRRDRGRRRAAVGRCTAGSAWSAISYPGITQLFVAATRPPHLAAITPLSVIDDTYRRVYPGGILNDGFAVEWAKDRARPTPRPVASGLGAAPHRRRRRHLCAQPGASAPGTRRPPDDRPVAARRTAQADALAPATFVAPRSASRCSSPARGRTSRPAATSPPCSTTSRPASP